MKQQSLRIAFIASECEPFVKTGGLADVIGSLPRALRSMGHEPLIIIPRYSALKMGNRKFQTIFKTLGVWMGNCLEWCSVEQVENDEIPVYLIECNKYFDRPGLYHDPGFKDYADNGYRFGFFPRAALQLLIDMKKTVDIVHFHDWQTATGAAYQKIWHWNNEFIGRASSVLTIHNIAYQGVYPVDCYEYLGLQWQNFTPEKFEDHARVNFLKGGISYADMVTTVSRKHASEIKTPEFAYGMAPYLNDRGDQFEGILNGVDYSVWNPEVDPMIPARYSTESMEGKRICKRKLQERMRLTVDCDVPLLGVVSRFASQKGLHLLAEALPGMMNQMAFQIVVLGSGDPELEEFFRVVHERFPGRAASFIGFSDELAHWIEAGADFFIMPSLYEPCGLNQIYSLKYGTLPVVRATGGLDDSIEQYDEIRGTGTGFKFYEPSSKSLADTVGWAVSTWFDRPGHYEVMQKLAMSRNFSWDVSAREYESLYRRTILRRSWTI